MKKIERFFEILAGYQHIRYTLKKDFERHRVELRIHYAIKMKQINPVFGKSPITK